MVTADEIRSRTFLVSLRGFDRQEVKTFLGQVADTMAELQTRLAEVESGAGSAAEPGVPDGELSSRPAAGAEDAQREVEAPDEAPAEPSPFAEIAAQTQRILEAAQGAAEEIRERAQGDAERELKQAKAQAARIIAEGERRREEIERVVDALTGARADLSEDLRGVGRTIERVLRELGPEPAAATVREALAAAAREEASGPSAVAPSRPAPSRTAASSRAETHAGVAGGGTPDESSRPGVHQAADHLQPATAPAVPADTQSGDATAGDGATAEDRAADATAGDGRTDATAREDSAGEDRADAPAGSAPAGDGTPTGPDPTAGGETEAPGDQGREPPGSKVSAEAPPRSASGLVTVLAPGAASATAATETSPSSGPAPASDPQAAPLPDGAADSLARRTQALGVLHPKLVRKLKRGLQDLQNATLDALRRNPERSDVEPFLPDETAVHALAALAEEQLGLANAAGIAAGAELSGTEVALEPSGHALAEQLGSELGGVLVTRLADALRSGFDAGQGMTALTERIDAVFTRMKNSATGDVAAVALVRAYEGGQKEAWAAGGVSHRRWVRSTEPPCSDPRCVDNEAAGAVPVEQRFPSRHDAPPVRPGCQCSTAPAWD